MALATETKDIVSQFELTDADVNKGVQEFLRQMGKLTSHSQCANSYDADLAQARDSTSRALVSARSLHTSQRSRMAQRR